MPTWTITKANIFPYDGIPSNIVLDDASKYPAWDSVAGADAAWKAQSPTLLPPQICADLTNNQTVSGVSLLAAKARIKPLVGKFLTSDNNSLLTFEGAFPPIYRPTSDGGHNSAIALAFETTQGPSSLIFQQTGTTRTYQFYVIVRFS